MVTAPAPSRSRSTARRSLAAAVAGAIALPLALAAPPVAASTSVLVPTPAGTDIEVSADLNGVVMSVSYSRIDDPADTYFQRTEPADDPYGLPLPPGDAVAFFDTGFWGSIPLDATVEVCFDLTLFDLAGRVPALYTPDDTTGTAWEASPRSASWHPSRPCATYPPAFGSDQFLLVLQQPAADPADLSVSITRVFDPLALGLGDGEQNGVYLDVTLSNTGDVPARVGLGADLLVDDVDVPLWVDATWGLDPGSGIGDFFSTVVPADGTTTYQVPDWPGKTYTFWLIDQPDGSPAVAFETYETGGEFSRVEIDINKSIVGIGSTATFAGSSVFPGATTTVQAAGLVPGRSYELWLTPGVDYFSFMLLGGILATNAVQVGTATVAPDGVLAGTIAVPPTVTIGSHYQLMIGDPTSRSWPAGTIESIQIVAPDDGGVADGPTPAELVVSIPVQGGAVTFTFPAGTDEGQTTVAVSTTGPAAVGFTLAGPPSVYYHLDTTATFSGAVEVCLPVPVGADPMALAIFHWELGSGGYAWQDITTRRTGSTVCGETSSFSPFALGVPDAVRLTSKEQCKNGGWATSTAPVFRNQGLCVAHFARLR